MYLIDDPTTVVASYLCMSKQNLIPTEFHSYLLTRNLFNFYTHINGFSNVETDYGGQNTKSFEELVKTVAHDYQLGKEDLLIDENLVLQKKYLGPVIEETATNALRTQRTSIVIPLNPDTYIRELGFHLGAIGYVTDFHTAQSAFGNIFSGNIDTIDAILSHTEQNCNPQKEYLKRIINN